MLSSSLQHEHSKIWTADHHDPGFDAFVWELLVGYVCDICLAWLWLLGGERERIPFDRTK